MGRSASPWGKKDRKHIGTHNLLGNFILPLLGRRDSVVIPKIQFRIMKMTHGVVDDNLVGMSIANESVGLASGVGLERDWDVG